jgi:hypothetical protein
MLYTSLPCIDYMLQEKNHLSSTRRDMKKQIEYLNGIYGSYIGIVGSGFNVQSSRLVHGAEGRAGR